ncbi:MAG: hypothetical protein IPM46_11175 [Flavobacteriales bacterium]|nr:hypothetical protein [Flavobacteriales bacterium]
MSARVSMAGSPIGSIAVAIAVAVVTACWHEQARIAAYWFAVLAPMAVWLLFNMLRALPRTRDWLVAKPWYIQSIGATAALSFYLTSAQFIMYLFGVHHESEVIVRITYGREELESVLLVVVYSLSFAVSMISMHHWTVEVTTEASHDHPPHQSEDCAYCGDSAGIICKECGSVQWPRLTFAQGVASYLGHHRWQTYAAALSIGFVGPISFHYSRYYDQVQVRMTQMHEYEQDATRLMSTALLIRSAMHARHQQPMVRSALSQSEVDTLVTRYYNLSWFGSRVLDYLRCTKCNDQWRRNNGLPALSESDSVVAYACKGIRANALGSSELREQGGMPGADGTFLYALDRAFFRYLNAHTRPGLLANTLLGDSITNDFNYRLKFLACLTSELTHNQNIDRVRSSEMLLMRYPDVAYVHKVYDCEPCLQRWREHVSPHQQDFEGELGARGMHRSDSALHEQPWLGRPYEQVEVPDPKRKNPDERTTR